MYTWALAACTPGHLLRVHISRAPCPPQVQQAAAQQAELLARLAEDQGKVRQQVEDTQQLLAAVQGVSAKQFTVLVDAIKSCQAGLARLREQQVAQGRAAAGRQQQLGSSRQVQQQEQQVQRQSQAVQQVRQAGEVQQEEAQQVAVGAVPPDPWQEQQQQQQQQQQAVAAS